MRQRQPRPFRPVRPADAGWHGRRPPLRELSCSCSKPSRRAALRALVGSLNTQKLRFGRPAAWRDAVGLFPQLMAAGEITAVAHIDMGQQPMGCRMGQLLHPHQPGGSGSGGGPLGQPVQQRQVVLESGAAVQALPGQGRGPQAGGLRRCLGFQSAVGGGQGAQQRRHLGRAGGTGQQSAGEHHAFGMVMGLADTGMQAAHPWPEALAQLIVAAAGVRGDRSRGHGGMAGGHGRCWAGERLRRMPPLYDAITLLLTRCSVVADS